MNKVICQNAAETSLWSTIYASEYARLTRAHGGGHMAYTILAVEYAEAAVRALREAHTPEVTLKVADETLLLKPCPFCGTQPVFAPYHLGEGQPLFCVTCATAWCPCQPTTNGYPSKHYAAVSWNGQTGGQK